MFVLLPKLQAGAAAAIRGVPQLPCPLTSVLPSQLSAGAHPALGQLEEQSVSGGDQAVCFDRAESRILLVPEERLLPSSALMHGGRGRRVVRTYLKAHRRGSVSLL